MLLPRFNLLGLSALPSSQCRSQLLSHRNVAFHQSRLDSLGSLLAPLLLTAMDTQRGRTQQASSVVMMSGNKKKKDCIELDGVVTESLPNAMFRVELEANQQVWLLPSARSNDDKEI